MKTKLVFVGIIFLSNILLSQNTIKLPAIFGDNMVLQQESEVPIWGKSNPGSEITVKASWNEIAKCITDSDSNWIVNIQTPKAGGPFEISINSGNEKLNYSNVLIGEVWLCSGQSNMEMPLKGWPPKDLIQDSESEILNSTNSNVRFFTVTRDISFTPKNNCKGSWVESSPKTSETFSATAYFFGKKLYNELKIPIGLIHSSWGGTPAEAWTNRKYIETIPEYESIVKKIDLSIPATNKLDKWISQFPTIDMTKRTGDNIWADLDFNDEECSKNDYDDSKWNIMELPTLWERTELGEFDGAVWFRKEIELPENWVNNNLQIELGPIDDFDITFVNGSKVGGIEEDGNHNTKRVYPISSKINNSNNLLIAVRANDTRGGGGLFGKPEEMKLLNIENNEEISLAGEWKYLPVAEFKNMIYYVFGTDPNTYKSRPVLSIDLSPNKPTTLFNAMIEPIVPFKIKGVIWYQGESNAGNPKLYERLFPTMINSWRESFNNNFPFYYVQIAPYNYGENTKSEALRDAQRKTLKLENTGMAVTLDIGDTTNIHPANKKDVGERLALIALAKNYGKILVYSGPTYKDFKIVGNTIQIEFDNIGSGLNLKNISNQFFISGPDKKFVPAKAKVENNKIIVWSDNLVNPLAVRYAWHNNSQATLFNKEGLPASSFRTDDWE